MILVDTSAWYALMVPDDGNHVRASEWFRANREPLLTTDYVLDETLTLLRARGQRARALLAGEQFLGGSLGEVRLTGLDDLRAAWEVFRRYSDKDWSFTDCLCYALIQQLKVERAFSFDEHFGQFGIVEVVP